MCRLFERGTKTFHQMIFFRLCFWRKAIFFFCPEFRFTVPFDGLGDHVFRITGGGRVIAIKNKVGGNMNEKFAVFLTSGGDVLGANNIDLVT